MKKLLPLFFVFLYAMSSVAQTGGPDGYGYIWRDNTDTIGPTYNWITIDTLPDAVQVTSLTDDNTSGFYSMGFDFPFYWYTVSDFKVGANGYIIFSNGNISSPFPAIPSAAQPHNYIAAMSSDLNFLGAGNTAECWLWTNNTDSLIISYLNVPFWFNNSITPYIGSNTFQIILSAVDSSITFQYADQQGASAATIDFCTVGIENNTGAIGLQHSKDIYPTANTAIKFYYPAVVLASVPDASAYFNDNEESGGIFLTQGGDPYMMHSQIKNTGTDTLAPFNVNMRIISSIGAVVVQENMMTDTLLPGASQDMVATLPFNTTTAGVYSFRTQTQLPGDVTITNNEKLSEVRVIDTAQVDIALSYTGDFSTPLGTGISWSGGSSGVGVEIVPPFYPCYLRKLEFYLAGNADVTGFYALTYDNTGADGGPGNLLDSTYVPGAATIYPDLWNVITLPTPIRIDSGSVFIEWRMEAENIVLGTDDTPPIGNRSYEVLGGWAIYRSRETQDPMIRAIVATSATSDVATQISENIVGEFYPTPSSEIIYMDLSLLNNTKDVVFNMYNMQGQLVQTNTRNINGNQRVVFNVSDLEAGVYVCNIIAGENQFNRKFMVR